MKQEELNLLFSILRAAVGGAPIEASDLAECSPEMAMEVLREAVHHDLGHLVAHVLKGKGRQDLLAAGAENYVLKAVYRYQQNKYEYDRLCARLERAEIPFIPLKGSIIRSHYPEAWMRTSCDIDILIHVKDLKRVERMLVDELKYKPAEACSHDVSFLSPSGVKVEMHFDLIEEGLVNASTAVLKSVWSVSAVKDGYAFWREMPDDLFYFYHVAHMAKHLLNGGCGIKPFLDLWILDRMEGADRVKRNALLARGELEKFAEVARRLSMVWFGDLEHDPLTLDMQKYVLAGGVYGNKENHISVQRQKQGGRLRYAMSLIFLPYDQIKFIYPVLQKHRWLTPFIQVVRWFKLIFKGRFKKATEMLADNNNVSDEQVKSVSRFLDDVGL